MNRQADERKTRDVDFLDRTAGVLETIEGTFCDQLESRPSQLLKERPERETLPRCKLFEIGEGERRHRHAIGLLQHFAYAVDRPEAACGRSDDADFSGGGRQ